MLHQVVKNDLPPISVVMPVHNAGHYLQTAVNSILQQDTVNIELLIIDDHSTDHAIEHLTIPSCLQAQLKVLRCAEHQTQGIVGALNLGIQEALHPYIARMDGDDIAHPKRLITQLRFLLDNPHIDIVGAKIELFRDKSDLGNGYQQYQDWINQQCTPQQIADHFFVESCIAHPTAMMHRSVLDEMQGYQDTTWPEDYDLWCRAFIAGKQFGKPDQGPALLQWRDHDKRASRIQKRYEKQQFLRCKAYYLAQYLRLTTPFPHCVVWGAGPTGLKLHDYLNEQGVTVDSFIDVNPKLKGRTKRGKEVQLLSDSNVELLKQQLRSIRKPIICAVGSRGARKRIHSALSNAGLQALHDFILAT